MKYHFKIVQVGDNAYNTMVKKGSFGNWKYLSYKEYDHAPPLIQSHNRNYITIGTRIEYPIEQAQKVVELYKDIIVREEELANGPKGEVVWSDTYTLKNGKWV